MLSKSWGVFICNNSRQHYNTTPLAACKLLVSVDFLIQCRVVDRRYFILNEETGELGLTLGKLHHQMDPSNLRRSWSMFLHVLVF